ncbi:glycoside hydrolase family 1 protein [Candidatus Cetobacterium colombiensis]|uniref:Glycoside hydrolase family 1 protein n=1 Tax=Candidatus Cetobacterium colombiensis TaxID=3073100 RepID=A0ABU4W9L5_9FUSO|nr:glycoside hydrolase family 1 protein [Candidatus Cetobacterium colombiensis]MDX8335899.1 glycoside hydrolase family 1 protein [Candidatus Cetobacterium colombiensis]
MYKFPEGFFWGAATSGVQSEGSKNQVNKSIWNYWFEKEPKRFSGEIGPDVVCDTYNKFKEDVALMKEINFNSFRTSIQWARLIKDFETGEVCEDAVRFYNEYIDELLKNGVEPIINLYHFDMPSELQEKFGGFESKKVVNLFVLFAQKAFELFGDRVKYWTTFNEPIVPVEGGYLYDFHYPNKKDPKLATQVAYNIILAHAKTVNLYKNMKISGEIGVILNLTPSYSRSNSEEDLKAAYMADLFFNRSFLDPMLKGEFPKDLCEILKEHNLTPETTKEELKEIEKAKVDFLGVNYYVPRRVKAKEKKDEKFNNPEYYFDYYINPDGRFNPYRDNNEIYPVALYDIAKNVQENYGNIPWYLAEIGIAMDLNSEGDVKEDGLIDDTFRTDLMKEHFIQLHRAIEEGSNCFGVHQWTFIDCWSWLNSFKRRYGFYRLDLETGKRIKKKHGVWFAQLAKDNGFEK